MTWHILSLFTVVVRSSDSKCSVVEGPDVSPVPKLDGDRPGDVVKLLGGPPATMPKSKNSISKKF